MALEKIWRLVWKMNVFPYCIIEVSGPRLVNHNLDAADVTRVLEDVKRNKETVVVVQQTGIHGLDSNFICKSCRAILDMYFPETSSARTSESPQ